MDENSNNLIPLTAPPQNTMHKPQRTHSVLPWVSLLPTKDDMNDSHLLWLLQGVVWINHIWHQQPHHNHWSNSGHLNQCWQGLHSTKEFINDSPPPKPPQTTAPVMYSVSLKNNPANYIITKLANFPTPWIGSMPSLMSSTWTMQIQSLLNPSKITVIKKSPQPTPNGTNSSPQEISSHHYTSSKMKHPQLLKNS